MTDATLWTGPIVDAHQHFWIPEDGRHPWLRPEARIPFRYGDYSAIKRRYLPEDYAEDARGHDIRATVYMEAEWDPADPVGETRWVSDLAARTGRPNAIIAQGWLDRADWPEVLRAQTAFPLVRSVRHKPGGPARPGEAGRSLMADDRWRAGYALLEGAGLNFDLQAAWWMLHEAEALARDFPRTLIVLNHTGLPADRSEEGLRGWHRAMARLAEWPNVAVKISGLGQPGLPWTAAANGWIVRETVAMFGPDRAMVASNFPVDSLCGSFDDIFTGFKRILAPLPPGDQAKLFHGTATGIYRPVQAA
jgi:predicted TIM-barrel fold metal-dependent hydrolase